MGDPGGLLSMGSHRVGHDWSDLAAASMGEEKENFCWEKKMNQWSVILTPI